MYKYISGCSLALIAIVSSFSPLSSEEVYDSDNTVIARGGRGGGRGANLPNRAGGRAFKPIQRTPALSRALVTPVAPIVTTPTAPYYYPATPYYTAPPPAYPPPVYPPAQVPKS